MKSPTGWSEPGQRPEFDEYTVVLRGTLHLKLADGEFDIRAGEAVIVTAGEWVAYSTPAEGGAEYIAVCLPAFSPARCIATPSEVHALNRLTTDGMIVAPRVRPDAFV